MDEEIEEPMSGDTSRSQPHDLLEAEYCEDREHQSNYNLYLQRGARCAHHCEQRVVGRNHDQNRRVKRAVTVKAAHRGEASDYQSKNHGHEIFHKAPSFCVFRGPIISATSQSSPDGLPED
jgi:hypothetical protein